MYMLCWYTLIYVCNTGVATRQHSNNTLIQCVRVDCRQPSNYRSCCKWKVPFLRYPIGYSNFLITHWNLLDKTPLDPSNRFDTIHRWSEVTESMVIKLSPFCGYNMTMCGGNERRFIALFKYNRIKWYKTMFLWSLTDQQSVFKRYDSKKHLWEF